MPPALSCRTHQAVAGWKCNGCGEPLCPDCAGLKRVGPVDLLACTLCGEQAVPLLRHRLEGGSLLARLPRAVTYPFRGQALLTLLGLGFIDLLVFFGGCAALIAVGVTIGTLFAVTRATAHAGDRANVTDTFSDLTDDVVLPTLRFVLATAPVWGGAIAAWRHGSPVGWVLVGVAAVLWVPMALLAAATNSGILSLVNPVLMVGLALKLGRDYWVYFLSLVGCALLGVVALVLSAFIHRIPVPLLIPIVASAVRLAPWMMAAHIGGLVLYLRGDAVGYGMPRDFAAPVLGDEQPRGQLPERDTPASRVDRAAIELPEEVRPGGPSSDLDAVFASRPSFGHPAAAPRRAARTSLDPNALPTRAPVAAVPAAARAVRAAMAKGDGPAALAAWEEEGRLVPELTVTELSWLGRSAASQGQDSVALAAFEAAAFAGSDAEVASVRVMLARLLDERLGRAADAKRWMERVAAEAPDGDAKRYAQAWLSKRG